MQPLGAMDFETEAIGPRPKYPPRPVGVALKCDCHFKSGRYFAFGHPTENDCDEHGAMTVARTFAKTHTLLCHHAGFDLDVAQMHWDIPWPATHHDTLIQAFLVDPDSDSLSLKPLAERYLGQAPKEQDKLYDWILAHVPEATKKTAGAYISRAPGGLVGKYAVGDVARTWRLHKKFMGMISKERREFRGAYDREIKVTRSLIKMERRGIPIRTDLLRRDVKKYERSLRVIEDSLCAWLRVPWSPDLAWSGPNFAEQLLKSKLVKQLPLTEKGNYSTSAESLAEVMDPKVAHEFEVRSQLATCLQTFMRPWLAQAEETGFVYARFNQVRNGDEWGKKTGARTGRLSMTPNLQNVIRSDKDPRVPRLRDYVGVGPYDALGERDYSQQELRLLGHFEDGPLKEAYLKDPRQDGHVLVQGLIMGTTGILLERRPVKDLNFGLIYGQGLALTADKLGVPREEARKLRKAHSAALPGVKPLQDLLHERARTGEPIWTWGGRRYYCEPPVFKNGRRMSFEYKMLNKLIQGSAADVTKQAMINYDNMEGADDDPLLLQVHDSLLFGITSGMAAAHQRLDQAMLAIDGIEIPMLSDGKVGKVSWDKLRKVA